MVFGIQHFICILKYKIGVKAIKIVFDHHSDDDRIDRKRLVS